MRKSSSPPTGLEGVGGETTRESPVYACFTRGFEHTSVQDALDFKLDDEFLSGRERKSVTIRIIWYDQHLGSTINTDDKDDLFSLIEIRRELNNLDSDVSKAQDVSADRPEIREQLTRTMQRHIDCGRSTPGSDRKNEANLSLEAKKPQKKKTAQKE